eukprot:4216171-Pyramimonas_sp.AAC.1
MIRGGEVPNTVVCIIPDFQTVVFQLVISHHDNESVDEPFKRVVGGRVYCNIVGESRVYTDPPRRPPRPRPRG